MFLRPARGDTSTLFRFKQYCRDAPEPEFVNFKEPKNQFRQPIYPGGPARQPYSYLGSYSPHRLFKNSSTETVFLNFCSPGIGSKEAYICSLVCRFDNSIPTRFLAPIDCYKIPAQDSNSTLEFKSRQKRDLKIIAKLKVGNYSIKMLVDSVQVHIDEFAASFESPSFNTLKGAFLINNQLKSIGRSSLLD